MTQICKPKLVRLFLYLMTVLMAVMLLPGTACAGRLLVTKPVAGFGYALNFDGIDDYVDMGDNSNTSKLIVGDNFTVEAWVYPTEVNNNEYHGFLGYDPGTDTESNKRAPSLWTYQKTNVHGGFGDGTNWDSVITDDNPLILNAWNHVAATFDGTTYQIYVNGQPVVTTNAYAGKTPNAVPIRNIGRVDNYFKGEIDEVRVWKTALSQTTIQSWMNRDVTSNHPNYNNLEGYWQFNNTSGTTAVDSSVYNNDGTLYNMVNSDWVVSTIPNRYYVDEGGSVPIHLIGYDSADDQLTYEIEQGPVHGTLSGSGGELTYTHDGSETSSDTVTYKVYDGNSYSDNTAEIQIMINPVNDAPSINDQNFRIDENSAKGTIVGTVYAYDVDSRSLTYRIVGGNIDNAFAINSATGELTVNNASVLDYESRNNYTLKVEVDDGEKQSDASIVVNLNNLINTDAEAVAEDMGNLTIGFAPGEDASSVTQDVYLPIAGACGTDISWVSNNSRVVTVSGAVYRPSYSDGDAEVIVTANVYRNGVGATKDFVLNVLKMPETAPEAVLADKDALTINSISFSGSDTANHVTGNMILPTSGSNGTQITWKSDNPAIAVGGTVTRPEYSQGDAQVTLTATITKGEVSDIKSFNLVVVRKSYFDSSSDSADQDESKPTATGVKVIVDGQEQAAGKETVKEENGQKSVELVVETEAITKMIDKALQAQQNLNSEEKVVDNILEVPVSAVDADKITTALTGDLVKKMDENQFKISVETKDIDYVIPAKEIGIEKVAETLGVAANSLTDIQVEVKINKLDTAMVQEINARAKENNYEVIFPPVDFQVVAKTKLREVTVSKFHQYVQRVMEIPKGVNPEKITTGIVYNSDGTFAHIPTNVFKKDGRYFASLNSLTNSSYSVIWNPVKVASVENHWSREAVNDMASRLVIKDPESFQPDVAISRGEFIEYITKAIGIYRTNRANGDQFIDVAATDKVANAITIATEYGLIQGYPDGTFRPDEQISREEAMTIYARAMNIVQLAEVDNNRIANYQDKGLVSNWAYKAAEKTLSAGVFNGRTNDIIAPKAMLTSAEAITAVRNLLIEGKLINN